eukprot:2181861-Pleurochrysis_carterae.AAC.1
MPARTRQCPDVRAHDDARVRMITQLEDGVCALSSLRCMYVLPEVLSFGCSRIGCSSRKACKSGLVCASWHSYAGQILYSWRCHALFLAFSSAFRASGDRRLKPCPQRAGRFNFVKERTEASVPAPRVSAVRTVICGDSSEQYERAGAITMG